MCGAEIVRDRFLVISLGVSMYACNPSPPKVAVVPVPLDEEHCWWAVYRTSLPLDTVANRFARAFAPVGGVTLREPDGEEKLSVWRRR
jgi:hypothetical protein